MELLLNLAWMLLVLPAYWLWQRNTRALNRVSSRQCLLALGCVLVLLFPVISASDDLHAMRAEMEESASKRSVRLASGEKTSTANRLELPPAALANTAAFYVPGIELLGTSNADAFAIAHTRNANSNRGPPVSLLG
jgi:hypothetical protein